MTKGTTMKSTPKVATTKKAPLKAKENFSTNRPKSGITHKANLLKARCDEEMNSLKEIMIMRIQKWWKSILQERELLKQKILAARRALEEHKMKALEKQNDIISPYKLISESNSSILDLDSNSCSKALDIQNSEEKCEKSELQTACFGKFKFNNEDVFDMSESYSPTKRAETETNNHEDEEEVAKLLNSCTEGKQRENKLSELSNLLKSNPDLLGVTDPTDDEKLDLFIQKLNQDIANKFREARSVSEIEEETPEKEESIKDKNEKGEESANKELYYEQKYLDCKDEPSEKSFHEYKNLDQENMPLKDSSSIKLISKDNDQEILI